MEGLKIKKLKFDYEHHEINAEVIIGIIYKINEIVDWIDIRETPGVSESSLKKLKCNCEENYNKGLEIWFCPAHGYQRR